MLSAASEPRPEARDWTAVGCAALVLAAAGAGLLPTLARTLGARAGMVIGGVLAAVAVVGVALWLLGRTIGLAPIHRRVEGALATLAAEAEAGRARPTPSEAALRAAVTLLLDAHHAPGPYTAETFAPAEAERRIGAALPLVVAVEHVLLEEGRIYRVFTSAPPAAPGEPTRT